MRYFFVAAIATLLALGGCGEKEITQVELEDRLYTFLGTEMTEVERARFMRDLDFARGIAQEARVEDTPGAVKAIQEALNERNLVSAMIELLREEGDLRAFDVMFNAPSRPSPRGQRGG